MSITGLITVAGCVILPCHPKHNASLACLLADVISISCLISSRTHQTLQRYALIAAHRFTHVNHAYS